MKTLEQAITALNDRPATFKRYVPIGNTLVELTQITAWLHELRDWRGGHMVETRDVAEHVETGGDGI